MAKLFSWRELLFGKDCVAVLIFLATKIEVVVARKMVNNNVSIIATATSDYAGFIDGEFLDSEEVGVAINNAICAVESKIGHSIDGIDVGVPAQFCNYVLKNLKTEYNGKIEVKQRQIDELFMNLNDNAIDDEYTIVSKSPIYYVLDDGVQTFDPLYCMSRNLAVKASCVLAKNTFLDTISTVLNNKGIKNYEFVPEFLAIDSVLIPDAVKQTGAIVIDFDYVSTCVTSFFGEGIVDMKTFGVGEGHVIADLSEVLKLNYYEAMELKKQLILTLQPNSLDYYEITNDKGKKLKISANSANDIVLARLDAIADIINKILLNFQFQQDGTKPIYITGIGICDITGAKNYLGKKLNKKCYILKPKQVEYASVKDACKIGLINFVYASNR